MIECPIIITGTPKSGTSLTAGIIHACGAWGGNMLKGSEYNPKGFFENAELINKLNQMGAGFVNEQKRAETNYEKKMLELDMQERRQVSHKILSDQGYSDGPWFFKAPDALRSPEFYHNLFPQASWIITNRNPNDVLESYKRFDNDKGGMLSEYTLSRFYDGIESLKKIIPEYHEVWPMRELNNDLEAYEEIVSALGLEWNDEMVHEFADKKLCHFSSDFTQ